MIHIRDVPEESFVIRSWNHPQIDDEILFYLGYNYCDNNNGDYYFQDITYNSETNSIDVLSPIRYLDPEQKGDNIIIKHVFKSEKELVSYLKLSGL